MTLVRALSQASFCALLVKSGRPSCATRCTTLREIWNSGSSIVRWSIPRAARNSIDPSSPSSMTKPRPACVAAITSSMTLFKTSFRSSDELKVCVTRYSSASRSAVGSVTA
jgi:hypothetical protein